MKETYLFIIIGDDAMGSSAIELTPIWSNDRRKPPKGSHDPASPKTTTIMEGTKGSMRSLWMLPPGIVAQESSLSPLFSLSPLKRSKRGAVQESASEVLIYRYATFPSALVVPIFFF
jgi:hypothetical protein